jgi:hypothetical protein
MNFSGRIGRFFPLIAMRISSYGMAHALRLDMNLNRTGRRLDHLVALRRLPRGK